MSESQTCTTTGICLRIVPDTELYEPNLAFKLSTNLFKLALLGFVAMALTSCQANAVTPLTLIARTGIVVNPMLKKYKLPSANMADPSTKLFVNCLGFELVVTSLNPAALGAPASPTFKIESCITKSMMAAGKSCFKKLTSGLPHFCSTPRIIKRLLVLEFCPFGNTLARRKNVVVSVSPREYAELSLLVPKARFPPVIVSRKISRADIVSQFITFPLNSVPAEQVPLAAADEVALKYPPLPEAFATYV